MRREEKLGKLLRGRFLRGYFFKMNVLYYYSDNRLSLKVMNVPLSPIFIGRYVFFGEENALHATVCSGVAALSKSCLSAQHS